jgi:hypothetical protein
LVGEADIDHGTLNLCGFDLQEKIGKIAGRRRTQKLEIFATRRSVMTITSQQRVAEEE